MYLSALAIFTFSLSTFAQTVDILSPSPNQLIHEDSFTVQIAMPVKYIWPTFNKSSNAFSQDSISPVLSISVAIGLQNCGSKPCPVVDNDEILGELLFTGDFKPRRVDPAMPPTQNFTFNTSAIAIPSSHATIHVAQFLLIGVCTPGFRPMIVCFNLIVVLGWSESNAKFAKRQCPIQ